jgi:opacity protein-like surface antigen
MKLKNIGGFVGLAGSLVMMPCYAVDPGFFVTGDVGVNLVEDIDLPDPPPVNAVRIQFDPGLRADATFGYTFLVNPSIALAAAGEIGFMYNPIDRGTALGTGVTRAIDGDFYQVPFLGKVIATFLPDSNWNPYVSAGGGGLYSRLDVDRIGNTFVGSSGDETDPAFQAEAGLKYQLAERAFVGFGYKYLIAFPEDNSGLDHFSNHSVTVLFGASF